MKLLIAGDVHGDVRQIMYLGQTALNQDCQAIVQVGDFGMWEHEEGGAEFLDVCSTMAVENDLPIYWIDGNHENHTMLREIYGPGGPKHVRTSVGFWRIRPGVFYIPRGTRWNWEGVEMMGLGGAYSVDKSYRLARERGERCPEWGLMTAGHPMGPGTMWWPEEEITQEELDFALSDKRPIDILFTHDKPRASAPGWNRKDLMECFPNQDKIQEVVRTLKPKVLFHGHLHYRYQDQIRSAGDSWTTVMGLSNEGRNNRGGFYENPESWITLDLAAARRAVGETDGTAVRT